MSSNAFGYDTRLPADIRDIFMWLCQDVASLHHKWAFYLGLFSSQENAELLSYLPASFNIIFEAIRNDLTMQICRLSDPVKTSGKDNLSLPTLVQHCGGIDGVNELLEDFLEASAPVRYYRNKLVGHRDLDTIIRPGENPIPGIDRSQIERILGLAGRILNTIYRDFIDGELAFDRSFYIGGADELIAWLKLAKQHLSDRNQRSGAAQVTVGGPVARPTDPQRTRLG